MKILADNHAFANKIVTSHQSWSIINRSNLDTDAKNLAVDLFQADDLFESEIKSDIFWNRLFLVKNAPASQYDLIINKLHNKEEIPDKILCLADSGMNFHGQRNRGWISMPGNIHLSVHFRPDCPVENFAPGFSILPAVSVLQTIDQIDNLKGRATVKWVNDILVDEAKVCGFLAHSLSEGTKVTGVVLGIGINVEFSPEVNSAESSLKSASLRELAQNPKQASQSAVFFNLIVNLANNYELLLSGGYFELLDIYRKRSVIIGRQVEIFPDPLRPGEGSEKIIKGRVLSIGDHLELYLEGIRNPITRGRLVLKN